MASAVDSDRANGNDPVSSVLNGPSASETMATGSSTGTESPLPPPLSHTNHDRHPCDDDDDDDDEDDAFHDAVSSTLSPTSITSPPYWLNNNNNNKNSSHDHQRSASNMSSESLLHPGAITLRDNETSEHNDRNNACWAKSVEVTDHTVVNGSATNIGAFVVWNIRVETLNGSYMNIRKRYSEFDEFRAQLILSFPNFEAAVPVLPPKSVISKFRPRFLEKRRAGLQYFLNCILLNPEFSGSPVLKEFLFA